MKPVVSALNAWSCTVVSIAAIIILSTIGALFSEGHHSMMGSSDDPAPDEGELGSKAVSGSIFIAVAVYGGFLLFCGFQAFLHTRQSGRGQISLN